MIQTKSRAASERFAFGKNWQRYVERVLDERRVRLAMRSLQRLLCLETLDGKTFLDVGCGSGLFSLAAYRLGAAKVVSFDFDPDSVDATREVARRANAPPERWRIEQGSVLDIEFLSALGPADIVYSWGVLHHTGAMWQAIDNAAALVRPSGRYAIAIYNRVDQFASSSRLWWQIKRIYVRSSPVVQNLLVGFYAARVFVGALAKGKSPQRVLREYDRVAGRGMDFWVDVRDWLGGFPYEYASPAEIFRHVHHVHGFDLMYLQTYEGHGCNEFTFGRGLS